MGVTIIQFGIFSQGVNNNEVAKDPGKLATFYVHMIMLLILI